MESPRRRPSQSAPLSELSAILGSLGASRDAALSAASGAWQAKILDDVCSSSSISWKNSSLWASDAERTEFATHPRRRHRLGRLAPTSSSPSAPTSSLASATCSRRDHGVTRFLVTPPTAKPPATGSSRPASERVLFFQEEPRQRRPPHRRGRQNARALPSLSFYPQRTLSRLSPAAAAMTAASAWKTTKARRRRRFAQPARRRDLQRLDSAHQQTLRRLMLRAWSRCKLVRVARRRVPNSELDCGKTHLNSCASPPSETTRRRPPPLSPANSDGAPPYAEPARQADPRLASPVDLPPKTTRNHSPPAQLLTQEALAWPADWPPE